MGTGKNANDEEYFNSIKDRIITILKNGFAGYNYVLSKSRGADPKLVADLIDELIDEGIIGKSNGEYYLKDGYGVPGWSNARAETIKTLRKLPEPDPISFQWWFDVETCGVLSEKVWELLGEGRPAFLGTPILGFYFAVATGRKCTVLDKDIRILNELAYPDIVTVEPYDVYDELNKGLIKSHSLVVIDPPWYPRLFNAFIQRSRALATPNGMLLCIFPSILTRRNAVDERNELLSRLCACGYKIYSIEEGRVSYYVPEFESETYKNIEGFSSLSWRRADLIIAKFPEEWKDLPPDVDEKFKDVKDFWRGNKSQRIFLRGNVRRGRKGPILTENEEFSKTVSSSGIDSSIDLWTSRRRGFTVRDTRLVSRVLELWEKGNDGNFIKTALKNDYDNIDVDLKLLGELLELWSYHRLEGHLRRGSILKGFRDNEISKWASEPSGRKYSNNGKSESVYRLEFQHDRDRIIWSNSFKSLASKTQVFPVEHSDHIRQRLTHTLTVKQLALTIAKAFGLDYDLTEATALAYDIGHTPFGHPGEKAINDFVNEIEVDLGGFSHYEHGVDILLWLENMYTSPACGEFVGLDLNPEVYEGVFKHMHRLINGRNSQNELYKKSKHRDIFDGRLCHLEGQAVRIADKVSYMIEDLEDGIRSNIISLDDLSNCRLFSHFPVDLGESDGETEIERFVSQRGPILSVIMEDLLEETNKRLTLFNTLNEVKDSEYYTVANSKDIEDEIGQVWKYIQKGKIHQNIRVRRANLRASITIRELILLVSFCKSVVDDSFVKAYDFMIDRTNRKGGYYYMYKERNHGKEYVIIDGSYLKRHYGSFEIESDIRKKSGIYEIPLKNLLMAKDYVASITDKRASDIYREFVEGRVPV
jgi:dGTPase